MWSRLLENVFAIIEWGSNTMEDKSIMTIDKEALEEIFYDLGVIENNMANFLLIVEALRLHFEDEMLNDKYAILCLVKSQLTIFHSEIYKLLGDADELEG